MSDGGRRESERPKRRVAPVEEVVCRLVAGERTLHVFHCTPEGYAELATGWLVAEGLREGADEPPRVSLEPTRDGVILRLQEAADGGADSAERLRTPSARAPRPSPPADLSEPFRELYARAVRYHDTGGIHAVAVWEDDRMVAHAEDVGRHNAVDKAIGLAVLARRELSRCGLVTTARVSGEMARKAARGGLAWIASRSVPTTLALSIAGRAGLTIVARAASSDALVFQPDRGPLGVILAGGRNRRFGGRAKALEQVGGRRIVDRAIDALRPLCADVVMIANDPASYAGVELEMRPDPGPVAGPVGGLQGALAWAHERGLCGALVVACDMPFVSTDLLDTLWHASDNADGAVPESDGPRGVEPLCAAYRTSCLASIERAIARDDLRVIGFFDDARIHRLPMSEVERFGAADRMFFNVNTPDELERARAMAAGSPSPDDGPTAR